ncbi:hypothetical protein [Streptomyces sp. DvalAA-43]|jgi:hypothetical protein|uniref:hypothetical protein n=1 Tax=Streptomyces sp. DvalAA-43 TaxID=1839762 RepID=UPI00081AECE2|nr:hypothetical protein GA0115234_108819 [Streptomyces sp. DvalAA-43]
MAARVPELRWEASVTTEEERDTELEEVLGDLRLVKEDRQIAELREAVDSTARRFTERVETGDDPEPAEFVGIGRFRPLRTLPSPALWRTS